MSDKPVDVVCVASWNVDLIAHIPEALKRGQTVLANAFERLPGGKGSNAAIAAQRQGAQVGVIARIGGDDFGQMGLTLWASEGVVARHVVRAANETNGTALILVYADGDNSIAVYTGAGAGLKASHVEDASDMLSQAKVVMSSCEVPLEATLKAFELARSSGAITLLNPAPAMPLPPEIWSMVDVLTPNEGELHELTGLSDTDQAARHLLGLGAGHVVVTLGDKGCAHYSFATSATGHLEISIQALPGHVLEVVDTIGAGDTFNGALAASLARGEPWLKALQLANAAAALSTRGRGAVAAMPTLAQVNHFLNL